MYRSALVSSFLTAVLLAGCGGEDAVENSAGAGDRSSASVEPPAPTTSEPAGPSDDGTVGRPSSPPAPTGDGSGDGSGDGEADGEQPASEQPASEKPGGVVTPSPTEQPAEQPTVWAPEVTPVHGGRVWAVYLAVGSPDSDWDMHMLGETESYVRMFGYVGSGIGSVGCDQGAAEALGFHPGDNRVAVYFATAAHAQEFVAGYDRQDAGSAQVSTYCLD